MSARAEGISSEYLWYQVIPRVLHADTLPVKDGGKMWQGVYRLLTARSHCGRHEPAGAIFQAELRGEFDNEPLYP